MDHEAFMSRKNEIDKMIQKQTGFLIFDLEGELLNQIQDMYKANQLDELAETYISNQEILKNRNDYDDMIVYFGVTAFCQKASVIICCRIQMQRIMDII